MAATTPPSPLKESKWSGPTRNQALTAFVILLIINILNYTDRSILSAVKPFIKADFGIGDTDLGLLDSSFLFIYGLATFPLGIWADRGTRKNIVAICVTIWSVATTIGGITLNFAQLFISRAFLGVGEAGYAPASLSMIGDYFPKEVRGRMLSIWSTGNLFGTAIGLMVGGLVAQLFDTWRPVFFLVGIPGLLAAFFIWRAVEPKRGAVEQEGEEESASAAAGHGSLGKDFFVSVRKLLGTPTYWVLVGAFVCSFFITGAALSWLPTYLNRAFSLTTGQAGALSAGALAGGALVGTLLGGWLADALQRRFPQGRMLVTTLAFLLGAPLAWLALSNHNLPAFVTIFIFAIIFLSMCLGPIQAIIQDVTTPNVRSTAIGLALLLGHLLGDASSPTVIGAISEANKARLGDAGALGFALTITAPTCLLLAGLVSLIGVFTVAKDMRAMRERLESHHDEDRG